MKKTFIITGIVVLTTIIALIIFNRLTTEKPTNIFAEVMRGSFEITVSAAGELLPEKSVDIMGPMIGQQGNQGGQQGRSQGPSGFGRGSDMRVSELKILDIVPEGTLVKQGDYVARLDRTTYDNTLKDALTTLATYKSNVEMKILDTAAVLTNLRDEIKNQRITVEEALLTLEQSKYEPPATIRQAEINYDKAKRNLEQKIKTYALRVAQTHSDIRHEQVQHLQRQERLVQDLQDFLDEFTITAPASGMIIYKKERNGAKRKAGSSLNPFDMVIATLPDLTSMMSKTFINEIEVNKIKPGQEVSIVVDAFPKKSFTGKVISIANIGEKLPNSEEKMFETMIKINGSDSDLRPAMTTGNKIIIKKIEDAVYIPLECVQTGPDSIPFVYEKRKTKQVVLLGDANEKNIIVEDGLEPGTIIYMNPPEKSESFRLVGQNLIPIIKEREKKKRSEIAKYYSDPNVN